MRDLIECICRQDPCPHTPEAIAEQYRRIEAEHAGRVHPRLFLLNGEHH